MTDDRFPTIDADRLDRDGWVLVERTTERLFSLPVVRVDGYTMLYEQPALRERVADLDPAGDLPWRFVFATRLAFDPPLAPGVGPMSVFPSVLSESRRAFAADLEDRGFEAVDRGRTQRLRTESGDRARLTKYTARFDAGDLDARIEAWFGVWTRGNEFRVAGGAYPVSGLPEIDPAAYRDELLALLRSVE